MLKVDAGATNGSTTVANLEPPPISREVIEWLSRQRLKSHEHNLELLNGVGGQRRELMLQRQANAVRQMRLADRVGVALVRGSLDSDLADRLFNSEQRRLVALRGRSRGRARLADRPVEHPFLAWRK